MALDDYALRYVDTELWLRLEPLLVKELDAAHRAITDITLPDFQTYMYRVGYLRGLQAVWKHAIDLTRVEQHNDEDC